MKQSFLSRIPVQAGLMGLVVASSLPGRSEVPGKVPHDVHASRRALNPEQTVVNINNLTVWVREDGFHDWTVEGSWNGTFPKGTGGIVFSEGTVWGGLVYDGLTPQLRVGGAKYMSGNSAGKILTDASGQVTGPEDPDDPSVRPYRVRPDWPVADLRADAAHFFLVKPEDVTGSQIEEIRAQYEMDWNSWPAEKGAPFDDINGVPGYQPSTWNDTLLQWNTDGDIPGIPGADQTLWVVYNDLDPGKVDNFSGSLPVGMEVQETYWGYSRYHDLANTVFKWIRLIYKGREMTPDTARIDQLYITQWSDVDNGYYADDFLGADTTLDLGYVYNAYERDRVWDYWDLVPPAGGYSVLAGPRVESSQPLDSAWFSFRWIPGFRNLRMGTFTFEGTKTFPEPPTGYYRTLAVYNLMRGCEPRPWYPDCDPLRDHLGNPTRIELAGDPVTGIGDLDGRPTPENPIRLAPGDRRLVLATGPLTMARGDTQEVVLALTGAAGADHLLSVAALRERVRSVRGAWKSNFTRLQPGTRVTPVDVPHNTEETGPFDLIFRIDDDPSWEGDITGAKLHFTVGNLQDSVGLEETIYHDSTAYLAHVPAFPGITGTAQFRYTLSVDYDDGVRVLLPGGAPWNTYGFVFGPDTTAPTVQLITDLPDVLYLVDRGEGLLASAADDRFPISVRLKWKVNREGTVRESLMNSVWTGEGYDRTVRWKGEIRWEGLNLGDTVYYWAEAIDSSQSRNSGESAAKWFVAREYESIGNWEAGGIDDWIHPGWSYGGPRGDYGEVVWFFGSGWEIPDTVRLERIRPLILPPRFDNLYVRFFHKHRLNDYEATLQMKGNNGDWDTVSVFTGDDPWDEEQFHPVTVSLKRWEGHDSLSLRLWGVLPPEHSLVVWWVDDIYLTPDSTFLAVRQSTPPVPLVYSLDSPYPNPFNPATTIEFSVPVSGFVTLTVYDLLGREIETILNRRMEAGHHLVRWRARNLPSGVYVVRMEAGEFSGVRKVTVLK